MKKLLLTLLIFLSFTIQSQTKIIKANPLGLAFNMANLGFEFSNKHNQSTTFSALYYTESNTEGFGVGVEKRFYFKSNKVLKGFHAGPNFGFLSVTNNNDVNFEIFSAGGEFGYQWFIGKHFALDLFSGVNFLTGSSYFKETIAFGIGFSLGFAW